MEWFDIYSLSDTEERQDLQVEGMRKSVAYVLNLVDQEIISVAGESEKVILGGISQGCAVAIHVLLAGRHRLGAFVGFCSWLPFEGRLGELAIASGDVTVGNLKWRLDQFFKSSMQIEPAMPVKDEPDVGEAEVVSLNAPCFLSHCKDDELVDIEHGRQLRDKLQKFGVSVKWDEHEEGGYWVQEPEGIDHLLFFLPPSQRNYSVRLDLMSV